MPKNLEESIQRLVDLVSNTTEAFTAALFLIDENKRDLLRLHSYQSLSRNIIENAEIPVGHGLVGWVAKHDRSNHSTKFERDTRAALKFYTIDESIKSFAAAPIRHNGQCIGVLAVDSKKQYVFTDKSIKLLDDFSASIARTLALGRGRIKYREDAEAFEVVHGILGKLAGLAGPSEIVRSLKLALQSLAPHDEFVISIKSVDGESFRFLDSSGAPSEQSYSMKSCRVGHVMAQQRSINMSEVGDAKIMPGGNPGWRSFLGAPVIANNQTLGGVALMSRLPKAFGRSQEMALSVIAPAIASSLATLTHDRPEKQDTSIDPVTGSGNHKIVMKTEEIFHQKTGAVIMVNLLGFSHVNVELGFSSGDSALKEAFRRLNWLDNAPTVVFRHYADRFVLVYDTADTADALAAMRNAISAIEEKPFEVGGAEVMIRATAGAAIYPDDGQTIERLLFQARVACDYARKVREERIAFAGTGHDLNLKSMKGLP